MIILQIYIRTDASIEIGTGHVMRCLTLASKLQEGGASIHFICKVLPGNLIDYIRDKGYHVEEITNEMIDHKWTQRIFESKNIDVDLLVVDHYGLDIVWETKMRPYVKKIMVIDDLADREHDCDILLDQNFYLNLKQRYINIVPVGCQLLLGPNYALLRDEFLSAFRSMKSRSGKVNRIFIFFGGSDPTNETEKTVHAIIPLIGKYNLHIDVVVGIANQNKKRIEVLCRENSNIHFYCQVKNIAELMSQADLSIGAGGSTTWERCFLRLPSLSVIVADNQRELTKAVATMGATMNLGESKDLLISHIQDNVVKCLKNPELIKTISQNCQKIISAEMINKRNIVQIIQESIL